jgi:methionyl-tRNA synthetase
MANSNPLYLTTPLYYVNAKPHLGHAYATILSDVLARHYRLRGREVRFLTGTDEHGEKIAQMASRTGVAEKPFVDEVSAQFQSAWKTIGLEPDVFYRTTLGSHYELVQACLQDLKDRGEIYFASYEGRYCVGCERFRTDQEWNEKGLCPDHLTPPEIRKESNYFFKMGQYQQRLKKFYADNPQAIVPSQYLKETLAFLEQPLEDLCISRPVSRLRWGIPLPFDREFVTYVWFDALLSYPGGLGYRGPAHGFADPHSAALWSSANHVIGKDILKTHAVYWPTMLMALGLPLFQRLQVSGFILMNDQKMSKSLGNVLDPLQDRAHFGDEPLRYYLLREIAYGSDSSFGYDTFLKRCNADLANGLGNLASRTLTLVHKNFGAELPDSGSLTPEDEELLSFMDSLGDKFCSDFDACRYHIALASWGERVQALDRYINNQKPWALAKDASKDRLGTVLWTACQGIKILGDWIAPVTPRAAAELRTAFGLGTKATLPGERLPSRQRLGSIPRLFPRLEMPQVPPV